MSNHKIIIGDSRILSQIKDQDVQLIITSPPYWQLKDYGSEKQIGFHDSYEQYINNLNLVWKECCRVLSDGCRLCINIGDQFARSAYYGRYKVIPIRTEIIRFCETLGMDYMGAIIWQKATTMNTTGGGAVMGSFPYPRNGILKIDYEFILIFKKQGKSPSVTPEQKQKSQMTREEWNKYFSSHWNFAGTRQDGHIAMFPEELPHRLIKMFSFVGETVFDPFLGSGTTMLAAKNLERNSIGCEINAEYLPIIKDKIGASDSDLFKTEVDVVIDKSESSEISFDKLPYIYHDPHTLDTKTDIKKNTYGSKIDASESEKEKPKIVTNILSPCEIELNSGEIVHLLGVKILKNGYESAMSFLKEKVLKKRVLLKFDTEVDSSRERMVYLYLENKTFINMHLIRTGHVSVETSFPYKNQEKFLQNQKS